MKDSVEQNHPDTSGQTSLFGDTVEERAQTQSALVRAYRFLAARPRSESELATALSRAGFSPQIVTAAIDSCRQQRFVDDVRFARDFIQSRLRHRPMGREVLKIELAKKGIEADIIAAALDEALGEQSPVVLADQAAEKHRKRLASLPRLKARQRLADALRRRGFDWETIQATQLWKDLSSSEVGLGQDGLEV